MAKSILNGVGGYLFSEILLHDCKFAIDISPTHDITRCKMLCIPTAASLSDNTNLETRNTIITGHQYTIFQIRLAKASRCFQMTFLMYKSAIEW